MGTKNPDRVPFEVHADGVETVGDMIRRGWTVHTVCPACGLRMVSRLKSVAKVSGENLVIWDKQISCRRVGCHGRAYFEGKPLGFGRFNRLTRPMKLPDGR